MKHKLALLIMLTAIITLFSGCSQKSKEEILADVVESAESSFAEADVESNTETVGFSFYLPRGFEITEETESNLLLENDDQTYILFYNALESTTSKINYEAADAAGNYVLLDSFEDDQRFGFVLIKEFASEEEETYELQVGIGGVKITTITPLGNLEDSTKTMMEMANSLAYSSTDAE